MKKKKINLWILIVFPIFAYIGYAIGLMITEHAEYGKFLYYLIHPFPVIFDANTKSFILIGLLIGLVIVLKYFAGLPKNPRLSGKEYGTARFEAPTIITKRLGTEPAKILGQNTRLSINDRKTGLNNNLLLIGGSGAGKSFRFIKPNILQCNGSMVITDPKGECLRDTGVYLRRKGYNVKVLNLVDMSKSDHYNPLSYLRTQSDVVKLVNIIIRNTTPKGATSSDPFWEKAESLYLQSLIFYVWLSPKMKGKRNLRSVIELMREARAPENEKEKTALDRRMDELLRSEWELKEPISGQIKKYPGEDHAAWLSYYQIRHGPVDTVRSVYISANARMGFLMNSPELLEILSKDDMDIPSIGMGYRGYKKQKTALFIVTPDSDTTYNAVAGMLYSQRFQELYFQADNNTRDGRLPIPVSLWMDEFANIALPRDFTSILSTMRSRGISANIVIQNMAQLKERYEKSWETITGNCDTLIYLGGNEQSTHKYISELLGKWTIEKQSSSESHGTHGNNSTNLDVVGRELMTADEVRMMDNGKELIFIRGEYPVKDKKHATLNDPVWQEAAKHGPYRYENYHGMTAIYEQPQSVQALTADEAAYESAQPGAQVIQLDFAALDRMEDMGVDIQVTLPESDVQTYAVANMNTDSSQQKDDQEATESPELIQASLVPDTIKSRIATFNYTDAQISQAAFASADGLTETQILEWFRPEVAANEMEKQRIRQISHTKKPSTRLR